ncbi:RNA-directed DNA polymerase [Candidatus Berkelbacteria bacterium]|nr:RNA-directed DNA polymerase [Candidatus Berkelbacteria bacterium]
MALRAKGIPIGNLTSQIFANIYMDAFDQFAKHELKQRYYLRYTDDFVILSNTREELENLLPRIRTFLTEKLRLELHPQKVIFRKLSQGIDFLGYVVLPHHTVVRTRTKKRMLRRIEQKNLSSYMGLLEHCDGYLLQERIQQLVPPEESKPTL